MLKRLCDSKSRDWDDYLPLCLFALREVPCASTGFSPFELIYSHKPKGPLHLLHSQWLENKVEDENLLEYVFSLRKKLEWAQDFAAEQREASKRKQKTWYDRSARERSFDVGTKVLVLMPSSSKKFLSRWEGPFEVLSKVSPVDYEIKVHSGKRGKRVYHINLLRAYDEPENVVYMATPGDDDLSLHLDDLSTFPVVENDENFESKWAKIKIGSHLSPDQVEALKSLVYEFQDIFSSKPTKVNDAEFKIRLKNNTPINVKPFSIPHACLKRKLTVC